MKVNLRTHLKEATAAAPNSNNANFQVVLIKEGLGNLKDCFYYTKECLQNAPSLFEGKKCYADHPSSVEENIRPERSTRDILGYYQNVTYQEGSDGRGQLVADLVTMADPSISWANALLSNSIKYAQQFPNSDFVGLSINAAGEADETPLASFLQQNEIPDSVMPKLQEAASQGIDTIRVVSALQDAVSCDLVTDAGAGGRILKMIEQEKRPMKSSGSKFTEKKSKEKEKKEPGIDPKDNLAEAGIDPKDNLSEAEAGEDGTGLDPNPLTSGAQPDHADAAQDTALFQNLIKQYLGDGSGVDENEAMPMAQHAYQCAKESGMDHEAAMQAAGNHLKMAHEIGKRMKQAESKESESETESESHHECESEECEHESHKEAFPPAKPAAGTPPPSAHGTPPAPPAHAAPAAPAHPMPPANPQQMPKAQIEKYYEAMRKQIIEQSATIAQLKESMKKHELISYFNKKMAESKMPNTITKGFRESVGPVRSKQDIDSKWSIYLAGAKRASEEVSRDFSDCLFVEKNQSRSQVAEGSDGFSDCT